MEFDFQVKRSIQFLESKHSVRLIVHLLDEEAEQMALGRRLLRKFISSIDENGVNRTPVRKGLEIACLVLPKQ